MKTQKELIARFGDPTANIASFEKKNMTVWDIPDDINAVIRILPNRMYVNKVLAAPLEKVFRELIATGLWKELKTYDGCFNVRKKRGLSTLSTHAFGIAVDFNAAWNPLGGKVTFSQAFLNVWRKHGWICGADWKSRPDGMHMQGDAFC